MIDWNIRFGDILVIVSLFGSVIVYAFRSGRFAESLDRMREDIKEMKEIAKAMASVITTMAVQDNRIDTIEDRLNIIDKRIEDLRKGDGWIGGKGGIDKEYR